MFYLEYVTEQTVLWRHPEMAETIRAFFRDAGTHIPRAFYDEEAGLYGYVFSVPEPKTSSSDDDTGRYYQLVATFETVTVQQGLEAPKRILPRQRDLKRIERQFREHEWFSGGFRGRLDRVAAVEIEDAPDQN